MNLMVIFAALDLDTNRADLSRRGLWWKSENKESDKGMSLKEVSFLQKGSEQIQSGTQSAGV